MSPGIGLCELGAIALAIQVDPVDLQPDSECLQILDGLSRGVVLERLAIHAGFRDARVDVVTGR